MDHSKRKIARSVLLVVLSILLAVSTAVTIVRNTPHRASAAWEFQQIVRSDKLTLGEPAYKGAPDSMDQSVTRYMEKVFSLGFAGQSPYKITSLSQGSGSAKFASAEGTQYADGETPTFYISSDMVTQTKANELFTTAGTTLSLSTTEGSQGGYVVFDFKIGGELLDAAIPSDQLFGLLGMNGTEIGLPFNGDVSGHFNTAQLFYKVGDAITDDEMNDALSSSAAIGLAASGKTTIYIAGDSLDDYSKRESAETLHRAAWMTDGNDVATSSAVVQKEDGWYQARIPVGEGVQNISLGLTFGTTNLFSACVDTFFAMAHDDKEPAAQKAGNVQGSGISSYFAIRNVDYKENGAQADSITISIDGADTADDGLVTAQVAGQAEQTSTGNTLTLNETDTPFVGKTVHLKLDEAKLGGKTFYGWDVGGEFYGGTEIDAAIMADSTAIKAIVGDKTAYEARIGSKFYENFKTALEEANEKGSGVVTVTVPKGETLTLTDTYTVNEGVTVVLPYDESGKGYASGVAEGKATREDLAAGLAWENEEKYHFNTVNLSGNLTVNGDLVVGGIVNAADSGAQSRTSGNYAELVNSGTITVNGTVDVYGRIMGNGTIDVKEGGKLAEPFLILDYTTGENAADAVLSGLLDRINGNTATTPFLRYAMVNVENTMKIAHGGQLYGYLSLYALGRLVSFDQPIVGTEADNCFMMLKDGANVEISYKNDAAVTTEEGNCTEGIGKTAMKFTGGATMGALRFTVFGVTFDSQGFVFSIPYNYEITLGGSGANYELATEFMVMPGATLTLGAGATLDITHTFWTLEGYQADHIPYEGAQEGKGKYYPSAEELAAKGYSKSGNFIVNGTLNVGTGGEKIAFLGIVQTTGDTGTMTIGENVDTGVKEDVSYQNYDVSWYDYGDQRYYSYPTAAGQFNVDSFVFTGKVRQAQDALRMAQPHLIDPDDPAGKNGEHTALDAEAEAAARAIRFFVLISPARVNDGFGMAQEIKAGNTYIAKRDIEWKVQSFYYFNDFMKEGNSSKLYYEEYEINQTVHGCWKIDHNHTEDEIPDVESYVAAWSEYRFNLSEFEFGANEPCKPVIRYHNALGCEEMPDTKFLINPDWELHVPYIGYPYSMNEDDDRGLSLYDIIKSSFFQHIVTAYPEKIDWAKYYIYQESVETDEVFQDRFWGRDGENPYLNFTVESANRGDIMEPGEYELTISFGTTKYADLNPDTFREPWDVPCAWFAAYDDYGYRSATTEGTIKVVVDPIPLLSAEDDPEKWGPDSDFDLNDWQKIFVKCSIAGSDVFDLKQDGLPAGTNPEDITVTSILVQGNYSGDDLIGPFIDVYPFLQCVWEVESYEGYMVQNDHMLYYTALGDYIDYEKEFTDPSACIEWHISDDGSYLLIKGDGKYFKGEYKYEFDLRKTKLGSVQVLGEYTYEGEPVIPPDGNIIVKDENGKDVTILNAEGKIDTDKFTVEFQNNGKAGKATVTVTATENNATYSGTVTGTFYITPAEAGELTVIVTLSGSAQKPFGVSATFNIAISGARDMTYNYTNDGVETEETITEEEILSKIISVTSDGVSATATKGKYDINFAIDTKTPITATDKVSVISAETIEEIVGSYKDIIFQFNGEEVRCKELGGYSGTLKAGAIEVVPVDLTKATNVTYWVKRGTSSRVKSALVAQTYTGNPLEPKYKRAGGAAGGSSSVKTAIMTFDIPYGDATVTITIDDILTTFEYKYDNSDHTNVGTAHFKFVPKTDYADSLTGYIEASFKINPKSVTVESVTVVEETFTYNGQEQTPTIKVTLNDTDKTELSADQYTMTFMKDGEAAKNVLNAGEYTVTVEAKEGGNYKFASASVLTATFTVAQADLSGATVQVNGSHTYNGTAQTLQPDEITVTVDGVTGEVTFTVGGYQNNVAASKEGSKATFTIEGTGNFTGTASGSFTIEKKQITVTAKDITGTYGDEVPTPKEFTVPEGALAESDSESDLSVTLKLQEAAKYVVGTEYSITGTGEAENYEITVAPGKYTVGKKTVNVTINEQTTTYNAQDQVPTNRFETDWTVEGLVAGDDASALNVKLTAAGCRNAGKYTITGESNATNYEVEFSDGTNKFVIEKKGITVTADSLSLSEGVTEDFAQGQLKYTVNGLYEDGNDVKAHIKIEIVNFDAQAKVGATFDIKVSFTDGYEPDNYKATFTNGKLTISASAFEGVVFKSGTAEYDGTLHTLTAENLPDGASATYTYYKGEEAQGADGVKNAGTYRVTVVIKLTGYEDYTLTVNLEIIKKKIEITANDVEKTYGEALLGDSELKFTVPEDALVGGDGEDALTVSLHWQGSRDKGEYAINGTASADNYEITVNAGTYRIKQKSITVTILPQNWATYTGKLLEAKSGDQDWSVAEDALAWEDGRAVLGVTLSGSGTDAGKYEIRGSYNENGNYAVTFEGGDEAFVIAAKSLTGATITLSEEEYVYKAAQWQPEITVKLDGFENALAIQTDFTVTYGENKNAGENAGSITVHGTGNFCEEETVEFTIKQKDIGEAQVTVTDGEIVYKAAQWQPGIAVKLEGFGDLTGSDYTVEYGDNVDAGVGAGSVTVKGTGNFCGEKTVAFDIEAATITEATVTGEYTYTGSGVKATVSVKAGTLTGLIAEQDYTVTYQNNIDAGENAIAKVEGTGNFKGEIEAKFAIAPKDIAGATVTVNGNFVYNGSTIVPEKGQVTVTLQGYSDVTFTLTAENNVSATAQAILHVSGTGNFSGTQQKYFTISPKSIEVTLEDQEFVYSGKIPVPDNSKITVNSADICSKNGVKDDLDITITILKAAKDAGFYALTASAGNTDYQVRFNQTARLTITKKPITVKANDVTAFYGDDVATLTFTAEGVVEGESVADVIKVSLRTDRTVKDAGTYRITGSGTADNYTFTVTEGVYTVDPREITVRISDQSHLYDGKEPTVPANGWSAADGAILSGDNLQIVLKKQPGVNVTAEGYAITGEYTNNNYEVTFVDGTFTIDPRTINVQIENQNAIYNFKHQYALNASMWRVVEGGNGLVAGETAEMLGIGLVADGMTDAGSYPIRGTWTNDNYAVTFLGEYASQEEDNGHAGVYSIAKLDISDDAIFILTIEGNDVITESLRKIRTTFAGDPLALGCQITYFEGEFGRALTAQIDPATLQKIGDYTVTVTIEDVNYCGSTEFTVVVTDADGYTQRLKDTLARLEALVGDKTAADLNVEDFDMVKEVNGLLSALDETERKVAGSKLAKYEALVEGWHKLADLDDMIETAETIADAPIAALFGAVAAISALAAVCCIIGKGGLL